MAYIMTTEAEIEQKAGLNASAAFDTTMMTAANLRAESVCNCAAKYNYSDDYATVNADVKGLLNNICSSLAAIEKITYDMDAIGIAEAEDRINVLRDSALRDLGILRDKRTQDFINGA
jgi:hypothetical protein